LGEFDREGATLGVARVRMRVGMELAGEATKGTADLGGVRVALDTEEGVGARLGRIRRHGLTVAGSPLASKELARLERLIAQSFARLAQRGPEPDAGILEGRERTETEHELLAERRIDDVWSDVKVRRENFPDEPLRRQRPKDGAAERDVIQRTAGLQELGELGRRAIDLDGRDAAAREVNAMRSTSVLRELEGAARAVTMKRPEKVANRRRSQTAGELHAPPLERRSRVGQLLVTHRRRAEP
jgi:hypothetical protein